MPDNAQAVLADAIDTWRAESARGTGHAAGDPLARAVMLKAAAQDWDAQARWWEVRPHESGASECKRTCERQARAIRERALAELALLTEVAAGA
jgi:hypothetical protein